VVRAGRKLRILQFMASTTSVTNAIPIYNPDLIGVQFPRVILHLDSSCLELSPQCKQFVKDCGQDWLDKDKINAAYNIFTDRFGTIPNTQSDPFSMP
jgi:hypothetical protein